jgi:putative membrane protein
MNLSTILKGIAMGIAEIIPGVSGGTIAFITGIYERLLNAIKSWNPKNLKLLFKGEFKTFWTNIDGIFLTNLFSGIIVGMVSGVFTITYLMDHYIEPLYGFFFGLIIASVVLVVRQVTKWDLIRVLLLIAGTVFAILVISINPVEGNTAYWFVFVSGTIAISALMMPGISGSFMLLIMGMYGIIIPTFKSLLIAPTMDNVILIGVFGLGLITGLLTFSRVLSWTFSKFHQSTLVVLTGFMVGSLYKIWPWRVPSSWMNKLNNTIETELSLLQNLDKHDYSIISEKMVLPQDYILGEPKTIITIICLVFGFLLVWLLDRWLGKNLKL